MKHFSITICAAFLLFAGTNSYGTIIVTAAESAGNVVFSGGGTADLTGLTPGVTIGNIAGVIPNFPRLFMAAGSGEAFGTTSGPTVFGTGSTTVASSSSGDVFGIFDASQIYLPTGYISGASLAGTMSINGATFASLGLTLGTYTWTWGSGANADSFTLQIGAARVPEPSTLALIGLGLVGMGLARRRKKA